jgi:hypothetical protein
MISLLFFATSLFIGGVFLGMGSFITIPFLLVLILPYACKDALLAGFTETRRTHVDDVWYVFIFRVILFLVLNVLYLPYFLVSDIAFDTWEYLEETFS